ncbi:MAG TPA: phosphatase PAP2 family protein [Thermoanaerobaculia bacterium]|nr:phosphatase PAP2 family protein [Thermoanaerobaculia bacterium]
MNLFSIEPVIALQNYAVPPALWKVITFLGNEEFFLLLMPFVYWCVNARLGLRLGLLVLLCDALNLVFKVLWALPRPYWIDSRVQPLALDTTFGSPSSHAQNAVAIWTFLAALSRKISVWVGASILVVAIGLSRVALGVHFPIDVLAGAAIGLLFLLAFSRLEPTASAWFARQGSLIQISISTLLSFLVMLAWWVAKSMSSPGVYFFTLNNASAAHSWEPIVSRAGALWGLGCGVALAQRCARFEVEGPTANRVLRFVVGGIGVALCWKGLAMIFPREPEILGLLFRFLRYALLTLWVVVGAPLLFMKLGWLRPRPAIAPDNHALLGS